MDIVLIFGIIFVISALSCKTANTVGLPTLVGFIAIGVVIGLFFEFEDMLIVEHICDFALLTIIFTGGFQTEFQKARPVLAMSSALSVAGTLMTAMLSAAFAYYILRLEFYQAMLLGAIISSTDVESVFSVLRSKQLDLKNNLGYVLELESGSNDPFAHILTVVFIALATGTPGVPLLFAQQILVGVASGIIIAKLGQFLINRLKVEVDSVYSVLLGGIALLTFGAASQFGGSGFLAVYVGGVIIGNGKLVHKGSLSRMYSSLSMLMQVILFIVLGVLFIPSLSSLEKSDILRVAGVGALFASFVFFVARPLTMFVVMKTFKRPLNEIVLVSWAGFRGASSIVFVTHVLLSKLPYAEYLFSIVFFVVMLSVIVQSSFIIPIARRLKLTDD
ncbi:MAG: potassium/proton antiporter [Oscillospiraceae bacterium]|nr:potassium/proton antiporter [Oscillospiraceae bacterium]